MLQTSESSDRLDNAKQKIATGSVTRRLLSKRQTQNYIAPHHVCIIGSFRYVTVECLLLFLNICDHIISVTLLNPFIIKAHLF